MDRLDIWIRIASAGLHLSAEHAKWWEKSLTGLRDLRLVSLDRFATYVLRTRESILDEGRPLAWAHDWVSNSSLTATFETLSGTSFIVNGAGVPSDSALIGAGATLQLNKSLSLEAKFDDQFADTSQIYTGTGTLRYSW